MAEEQSYSKSHENETTPYVEESSGAAVESTDRGLFDFIGKKHEEKPKEDQEDEVKIAEEFDEKVQISDDQVVEPAEYKAEEKKEAEEEQPGIFQKLHRSDSSSSSSSDEEGDDEEKKKKKKEKRSLKEKFKGEDKQEEKIEDTNVTVEVIHTEEPHTEEQKKGFLEKIKEKLPGGQKKTPEEVVVAETTTIEGGSEVPKEKKGIFEKIKEKIPGYHSKAEEEKEKESGWYY